MTSGENNSGTKIVLAGLSIMVTRAQHQAEWLSQQIEDAGGRAIRLPLLEIRDTEHSEQLDALIDRLAEFDIAIFISSNAVRHALACIRSRNASLKSLKLAAVGLKTAQALKEAGYPTVICPQRGFNSEELLKLNEMQSVRDRNIVIFRGEGGRELLAETLIARGAQVQFAEVYRRAAPRTDPRLLKQSIEVSPVDLITIGSVEALKNLLAIAGPELAARIRQIPLLVGSQRMLQTVREMSFTATFAAQDSSDEAMFAGILQWSKERRGARSEL